MFGFECPCPFSGNLILRLVVHLLLHPWFYSGFFKLSALNCGNSLEFLVFFVFFSFFFSFSSCWPTLALSCLYFPKLLLLSCSLGVSLLNFLQLLLVTPATFSHTKNYSVWSYCSWVSISSYLWFSTDISFQLLLCITIVPSLFLLHSQYLFFLFVIYCVRPA